MARVWSKTGACVPQSTTPPVDRAISLVATPQHGVITLSQLCAAGLTASGVRKRVVTGRLHRIHRGVYAVGHRPPSPLSRAMAAVLACGDQAVLSHRSAAALWDFGPKWRGPVDVTAPTKRSRTGISVHRSRLDPQDTTVHYGIPITTPARTLLDLAEVVNTRALERAVNEARVQRRVSIDSLRAQLARTQDSKKKARLQPHTRSRTAPTRSAFEDAFRTFVYRYDLPIPEVNQVVAGYTVDMLWREHRLIVELDSREFHDHELPFEVDRDKDATLLAAGHPVVRVTWTRLQDEPDREAVRLRALLEARQREAQQGRQDSNLQPPVLETGALPN